MPTDTHSSGEIACLFCNKIIVPGPLDPCALHVVACIDQPRTMQKEQAFFCHIACLRFCSHSSSQGSFYIAEENFATIGEIEGERLLPEPGKFVH